MSNPNQDIQIEAIVERVALAVETRIQMREAERARVVGEQAEASRRWRLGQVPSWAVLLITLGTPIAGGGVLFAKINDTGDDVAAAERKIEKLQTERSEIAITVGRIDENVKVLMGERGK